MSSKVQILFSKKDSSGEDSNSSKNLNEHIKNIQNCNLNIIMKVTKQCRPRGKVYHNIWLKQLDKVQY